MRGSLPSPDIIVLAKIIMDSVSPRVGGVRPASGVLCTVFREGLALGISAKSCYQSLGGKFFDSNFVGPNLLVFCYAILVISYSFC
jgi:uncharacterized membrane protein YesL